MEENSSMDMWLFFAICAAILTTMTNIGEKKQLFHQHATQFSLLITLYNFIILLPFLFVINYNSISATNWILIIITGMLDSIALLLIVKAIRHRSISLSFPLLAFSPALTAIIAFLFLQEGLSLSQIVGIIFIVIGAYVLEHREHETIKSHIKHMIKSKYIRYLLIAILIYGFTSVIGRKLLSPISAGGVGMKPFELLALVQSIRLVVFLFFAYLFYDGLNEIRKGIKNSWFSLLIISILSLAANLSYSFSLSYAEGKAALVTAIRRTSILFTTYFGGEIFKERMIIQRIVAAVMMVIGGIILVL